jgi:hypothetical protein
MRNVEECLAKTKQMDIAALASPAEIAPQYRELANVWRWVAGQAEWQDAFQYSQDIRLH